MTDFGRRGIELLKEVINHDRRSIPPYNEELMRQVMAETKEQQDAGDKIVEIVQAKLEAADGQGYPAVHSEDWNRFPSDATAAVVHHEAVKRNKRLMLAYLMERAQRLKAIRWSKRYLPAEVASNCSPQELEFYRAYDKVLSTYMGVGAKGIGLDLTVGDEPPIGAWAEDVYHYRVLVTQAPGTIFSHGRTDLVAGNQVQLMPDEAEPLLKEGILEVMKYDFR